MDSFRASGSTWKSSSVGLRNTTGVRDERWADFCGERGWVSWAFFPQTHAKNFAGGASTVSSSMELDE